MGLGRRAVGGQRLSQAFIVHPFGSPPLFLWTNILHSDTPQAATPPPVHLPPSERRLNTAILPKSARRMPPLARYLLMKVMRVKPLLDIYHGVPQVSSAHEFAEKVLEHMGITVEMDGAVGDIPDEGPVLFVANHPFGGLEGLILAAVFGRVRPDLRIMANYLLGVMPELAQAFIAVNPFGGAQRQNIAGLREARDHLAAGHALGMFPAGTVSHWHMGKGIVDPAWNPTVARMAKRCQATVVPVYFHGRNGFKFNLAGFIHPSARTLLLPSELLNKSGKTIRLTVGTPVPPNTLDKLNSAEAVTEYLRMRCYDLKPARAKQLQAEGPSAPIAPPGDHAAIMAELAALPPEKVLLKESGYTLYLVRQEDAPATINEMGRVREITFREVGEGSGLERDLDVFDQWYEHLILWHDEKEIIAGAYRLGHAQRILAEKGVEGLYLNSLFRISPEFFRLYPGSMEVGRAMVTQEFQKDYAPLHLLWKGLGAMLVRNPELRYFFGPTSLSLDLRPLTLRTIISYLERHHGSKELSRLIKGRDVPKKMLRAGKKGSLTKNLTYNAMSALVRDMEGGRSVPVLFKHYLRLGGRIAAFHADLSFNTLDAFLFMDLAESPRSTLGRYIKGQELEAFYQRHPPSQPLQNVGAPEEARG